MTDKPIPDACNDPNHSVADGFCRDCVPRRPVRDPLRPIPDAVKVACGACHCAVTADLVVIGGTCRLCGGYVQSCRCAAILAYGDARAAEILSLWADHDHAAATIREGPMTTPPPAPAGRDYEAEAWQTRRLFARLEGRDPETDAPIREGL